jgi:hypothetical protein
MHLTGKSQILNTYFWILTALKLLHNMIRRSIIIFIITCVCHASWAQGDHLTVGIGPSMIYGDNSGQYRDFKFKILPAISLSFNKQVNENIAVRGSLGAQMLNSGDYDVPYPKKLVRWGDQDQAYRYKGMAYLADAMPIFMTNPNEMGMMMSTFQFYVGLGVGAMFVDREQETLKNGIIEDDALISGDIITSKVSNVIPYIPTRIGISTNSDSDWDIGLEFVLIVTTNSKLDGNNIDYNGIAPDMAGQILFTVKRYIGKRW